MLNVIRMEFDRMLHMKSLYIVLICCAAIVAFGGFITSENIKYKMENATTEQTIDENGNAVIIHQQNQQKLTLDDLGVTITSEMESNIGMIIMFCAIFGGIYIGNLYKRGYIKNLISAVRHRWYLPVAKMAPLAVVTLVYEIVVCLVSSISMLIFFPDIKFGSSKEFFELFFMTYLLMLSFNAITILFSELTRGKTTIIIYSVLISTGFIDGICSLINLVALKKLDLTITIQKYLVSNQIVTLNTKYLHDNLTFLIIFALITLVLYNVISSYIVTKRDV
jgi:ABC-type transport system involved in multi-copper enzyme maturation permease subunit